MAIKIDKSKMSDTPWGEVDKSAMGKALATAYAAGNVTKAQIREVYAFIPEDAFGKDSDGKPVGSPTGKPTFAYTKAFGPHHEMKGDSIVLNRGGLGGAAGAVAGSRSPSGPSLSSGDLAKAKAHLRRHYKAMKMEMPAGMKEALEVRRAERGSPLTEMVKGSLQYMGAMIEDAFREQFKQPDFRYDYHGSSMWCPFYIVDTFADHVVVSELGSMDDCELAPDEYYLVTYTRDADGKIVFAPREEWEIVELAYQPQTQNATPMGAGESLKPPALPQAGTTAPGDPPTTPGGPPRSGHGQVGTPGVATGARRGARMEERVKTSVELLESSEDGKTRKIRVNGLMTAGVVNGNGRRYPQGVVEAAVAEWRTHLHESAGQGRLKILTGEADHPRDKGKKRPEFLETVVKWTNLAMDGPRLDVEGELILTSKGKDVEALMEAGVMPGGSVRGYYEAHEVKEGGRKVEEVEWCEITGADLVGDPSFDNVADLLESQQRQRIGDKTQQRIGDATKGDDKMDPEEIRKFIAENPQMFEGLIKGKVDEAVKAMSADQLKALEEAVKKAQGEADKAVAELEGRKKAEVVEKAIAEATKELPYGDMNEVFVGAVRQEAQRFAQSDKPDEAVKAFVEAKRKEYDAMAAKSKLAAMGMTGIKVIGPVIESETDTPEYAKGSQEFYESLVNAGHIQRRELRKSERINDIAALKMLRRFDAAYRPQLMRESKLMDEAELSTDLNVPYTVSRAILQAAWPQLVATSIFDFDTIEDRKSVV